MNEKMNLFKSVEEIRNWMPTYSTSQIADLLQIDRREAAFIEKAVEELKEEI